MMIHTDYGITIYTPFIPNYDRNGNPAVWFSPQISQKDINGGGNWCIVKLYCNGNYGAIAGDIDRCAYGYGGMMVYPNAMVYKGTCYAQPQDVQLVPSVNQAPCRNINRSKHSR